MTRRKVYLIRAMRYDIAREIAASFGLGPSAWRYVSYREELQPPFELPRGYKWTDVVPLKRRKADDYTLEIAEKRWAEEIAQYFKELKVKLSKDISKFIVTHPSFEKVKTLN